MSPEAKAAFLAERPRCEVCGHPSVEVDHDHVTHQVRGALCRECNGELGSLEAALRVPEREFQSRAGDLHRALWRTGSVVLTRYARAIAYLGLTKAEYERRLRAVHAALTLPYVYWTPVTAEAVTRRSPWTKIGPLCDDEEAERHLVRLLAAEGLPHLYVRVTREPDDGVNSPAPRGLVVASGWTEGAREYQRELLAAKPPASTEWADERDRAFAELAVPVLTSRPLTAEQFAAAHWRDDEAMPGTPEQLAELLLSYGYLPRWLDLAVRFVLEDLGEDLPDRKWAVPSRARHHWRVLFAHWRDRRAAEPAV
ncbi:endonuclease domain-containing protein [Kitasatospora sp. NPDC001664]